jgi:hypothetical protein
MFNTSKNVEERDDYSKKCWGTRWLF